MKITSAVTQITGKLMSEWYASVAFGPNGDIERWDAQALGVAQPTAEAFAEVLAEPEPAAPAQTVFSSRELMETLFTEAEQEAIFKAAQTPAGWEVFKFVTFTAATPQVDITNAEFVADIKAVQAAGLLTQARAAQVLAGTPAPAA